MSEKCSHNQLFMTKYECRTHFCMIETEKSQNMQYKVCIGCCDIVNLSIYSLISLWPGFSGISSNISKVVVTPAGHFGMCLDS